MNRNNPFGSGTIEWCPDNPDLVILRDNGEFGKTMYLQFADLVGMLNAARRGDDHFGSRIEIIRDEDFPHVITFREWYTKILTAPMISGAEEARLTSRATLMRQIVLSQICKRHIRNNLYVLILLWQNLLRQLKSG